MHIYKDEDFQTKIITLSPELRRNANISEGKRLKGASAFESKAKAHPNHQGKNYDYDNAIYLNCSSPMEIFCPTHSKLFSIKPSNHLNGGGCPDCASESRRETLTTNAANLFVTKAKAHPRHQGKNYGYEEIVYVDNKTKVKVWCPLHTKYFLVTPNNHKRGKGCPTCGGSEKSTTEKFKERSNAIHYSESYDYSKVIYINKTSPVIIICPEHGEFEQTPNAHLSGKGCSECNESKGEKCIAFHLDTQKISYKKQVRIKECKNKQLLPFDFGIYNQKNKLVYLIEYHGIQHFKPIEYFGGVARFNRGVQNDTIKLNYCLQNNIPLLIIPYTQKKNIPELLKSFIGPLS